MLILRARSRDAAERCASLIFSFSSSLLLFFLLLLPLNFLLNSIIRSSATDRSIVHRATPAFIAHWRNVINEPAAIKTFLSRGVEVVDRARISRTNEFLVTPNGRHWRISVHHCNAIESLSAESIRVHPPRDSPYDDDPSNLENAPHVPSRAKRQWSSVIGISTRDRRCSVIDFFFYYYGAEEAKRVRELRVATAKSCANPFRPERRLIRETREPRYVSRRR